MKHYLMMMSPSIYDDVTRLRHRLLLLIAITLSVTLPNVETALCDFNPPRSQSFISITNITEDLPVGSTLFQVSVDGSNRQISLTLVPRLANSFAIALNQTTRSIYAERRLQVLSSSASDQVTNVYTLTCTVLQSMSQVSTHVYLTVFDTNDHPPVFTSSNYSLTVSETTPIDSVIAILWATDLDPSDTGVLRYSIDESSSPYASSFGIRLASSVVTPSQIVCEILLKRPLSYSQADMINITIEVKDNGDNNPVFGQRQPQFSATANLIITVTSATDYNPVFTQSTYLATVDRYAPLGTVLNVTPSIGAIIPNDVTNTSLMFNIVRDTTNEDSSYFTMSTNTGELMTSSLFNASTPSRLAFQIQVTESAAIRRYSAALVRVSIFTASSSTITSAGSTVPTPIFGHLVYNVTIASDSPIGTLVMVPSVRMTCSDWSSSLNASSMTYTFVNPGYTDFTINPSNGEIRTARTLNYDINPSYFLQVAAAYGSTVSFLSVNVTLLPSGPQFANPVYTFNATTGNDVIGSLKATGSNPAAIISYSIVDPDPHHPVQFSITPDGLLRRSAPITATVNVTTFTFAVVATDNAVPPRRSATVVVVYWWSGGDVTQVMSSSPSSLTSQSDPSSSGYLIGLIIIGVVGGFLFLIVIALLIFISRKTARTCEQVQHSRSDLQSTGVASQRRSSENLYENGFRATDDFHGLMFQSHVGESSTDVAFGDKGGRSPLSSAPSKLNERSTSINDASKNSGILLPGFSNGAFTGQVSPSSNVETPPTGSSLAVGIDPGVVSSTETLTGPPQMTSFVPFGSSRTNQGQAPARNPAPYSAAGPLSFTGSNQSSIYMSSPDGSMLSVTTQAKSDDGTGITVYY